MGRECLKGCLKPCTKKPNKTCCNRKLDKAKCDAVTGGLFCGAPTLIEEEELPKIEDSWVEAPPEPPAPTEGVCAGKKTSFGRECLKGCLKPCTKKPSKTCCNRKLDKAKCDAVTGGL